MRGLFLLLTCVLTSGIALAATVRDEGPDAEARLTRQVRLLLEARDFDGLERMAASFRDETNRFADGNWKLPIFYDAFNPEGMANPDSAWTVTRQRIDEWAKAIPQSVTAQIALANWWIAHAWQIRGKGWSDSVPDEIWKIMKERLVIAEELLNAAGELPVKCPARYQMLQRVALGAGWDTDRYVALVDQAVAANPKYLPYYLEAARHMLPKWYGQVGEWERFAVKTGSAALFARIAWANAPFYSKMFEESDARWEPMREGFDELRREYPASDWILNNYARFACVAGDRDTARRLFAEITPEKWMAPAWESKAAFEQLKTWSQ